MDRENWDDLRYVLAVAEAGSVSGAARRLGVNHATVLRRVAAFEERHGAEVFDRTVQGYQIPPDRLRLFEAAREVSTAFETVERLLKGTSADVAGVVRITSTDSLCLHVLPGIVEGLRSEAPGLRIELHSSNAHADLGRLQAEISIRPALRLPDDLKGEAAGIMRFAAFAPKGLPDVPWLGLRGALGRSLAAEWLAGQGEADTAAPGADSFPVLRELVARKLGKAVLPLKVAEGDPRLERLPVVPDPDQVPVWVASHSDLADVPRLRVLRLKLATALREVLV